MKNVTIIRVHEKQELINPKSNRKVDIVIENHKRKGGGYHVHYQVGEEFVDCGWTDTAHYALGKAQLAIEDIVYFWREGRWRWDV